MGGSAEGRLPHPSLGGNGERDPCGEDAGPGEDIS